MNSGILMKRNDLTDRWANKLKSYIHEHLGVDRQGLSATDFRHSLKINFEDGSFALFQHAFYILDRENNEVGVFTEHCGYHIFPLAGTELELLESKGTDVGTE
jgi:hypothetical protein